MCYFFVLTPLKYSIIVYYARHLFIVCKLIAQFRLQSNVDFDDKLDDVEFKKIIDGLTDRVDNKRFYWHVFDPSDEKDKEPVCGDLVDDLGDIYKDLKYSILIFNLNKPDSKENAVWQFKFDFDSHWGNHCIRALNAIHFFQK